MLRRRLFIVQQRTAQILSVQGMFERHTGMYISHNNLMKLTPEDLYHYLKNDDLVFTAKHFMSLIQFLTDKINAIEKRVLGKVKLKPQFQNLLSMPGIGTILGLTIMLETGEISRFETAGDYTSYCRCVRAEKTSNGKKKGLNNRKCGNKFLSWAFVEAVHCGIRYSKELNSFYQRKKARSGNPALATKAAASKYSKGAYYIMRDQIVFDVKKMFG